jgi:colanic acid/amylovoran biosynthesis glycosyltransferase
MKTLAILSPIQNAYSETFIRAHKQLPFNIRYYYGNYLPFALENTGNIVDYSRISKLKAKLFPKLSYPEYSFYSSLKKEKVDCVLAEYGPTAAKCLKAIEVLKVPLIVHYHGFDASAHPIIAEYKNLYIAVFQYATKIIVVSKKMYFDLIQLGCPTDKLIINTYGPDPYFFEIAPHFSKPCFVSIGRFVDKKAPYLTIAAFKKVVETHPEAQLFMAGDGPLLNSCKNLVKVWNLSNNVVFKGAITSDEVQGLFKNALAFVQHSIVSDEGDSEGAPVAILEASAAGLPVIATRHGGIPDIILENETGFLVDELDISLMSNYMIRFLDNPDQAKKMGIRGKNYIKKNFQLESHLKIITGLVNDTL